MGDDTGNASGGRLSDKRVEQAMTITTEQATQMAQEVGITGVQYIGDGKFVIDTGDIDFRDTLVDYANAVRRKTLLEAAEYGERQTVPMVTVVELRRMADEK